MADLLPATHPSIFDNKTGICKAMPSKKKQKPIANPRIALNSIIMDYQQNPRPWDWGKTDCCMFYANVVKQVTGQDLAKKYRGKYKTELGAARLIKKFGSIEGLLSDIFGPPVSPCQRFASVLDPVIAEFAGRECVGVCIGWRAAFLAEDGILITLPLEDCKMNWKVGPCLKPYSPLL